MRGVVCGSPSAMKMAGGRCGNGMRPTGEVREARDRWDMLGGMLGRWTFEVMIHM